MHVFYLPDNVDSESTGDSLDPVISSNCSRSPLIPNENNIRTSSF